MVIELDKSTYRSNHHTIFMGRDIYIIGGAVGGFGRAKRVERLEDGVGHVLGG